MRKLLTLIFCIIICFCNVWSQNEYNDTIEIETNQRPKVAVVLSGGGAKGCAHIGALKVIEQAGIPIDMICGTSMGALMGGLYAIGYDSKMLDSLVRVQDWNFLLSDKINPKEQNLNAREKQSTYFFSVELKDLSKLSLNKQGFVKGKNLANLFSQLTVGYHDSISFDSLPMPFACVATEMVKYKEFDWHSGYLSTAMRSSMSIPGVFSPVKIDSMVLVDGGLQNNFPADLAKKMGADIIIGVSVQDLKETTAEDFKSTFSLLNKLMDINTENKMVGNLLLTDCFIKVNVKGYSAASFNQPAIDTLIRRGEEAAREHWEELMELKKNLGLDSNYIPKRIKRYKMLEESSKVKINTVKFHNITPSDQEYLIERFHLNEHDSVSILQIEKAITALRGNLFYNDASYQLNNSEEGYNLQIESEGKKAAQMFLGVRFDNEEKVSMQFHAQAPFQFVVPIMTQATIRLGKRSMAHLQATFNPSSFSSFTTAYTYWHHDINLYYKGDRYYNVSANQHQVNFGILDYGIRNFFFDVFIRWDYLDYQWTLGEMRASSKSAIYAPNFYSYNARIHFNSLDKKYFSTSGLKVEARYAIYTDNLYRYKDHSPLNIVSLCIKKPFAFNERLILTQTVYGRSIYGEDVPAFVGNYIGGNFFEQYFEQHMPFAGIGNVEYVDKNFMAINLNISQRLLKNHYVGINLSIGQKSEEIKDIVRYKPLIGTNLNYNYDSFIGPVGTSLNWSNRTKELYLFVNIGYQF